MTYRLDHSLRKLTLVSNEVMVIPKGWAIENIDWENTAVNSMTGGFRIGTYEEGNDVVTGITIPAKESGTIPDTAIGRRYFSGEFDTRLYLSAVINWNGASLNLAISLRRVNR